MTLRLGGCRVKAHPLFLRRGQCQHLSQLIHPLLVKRRAVSVLYRIKVGSRDAKTRINPVGGNSALVPDSGNELPKSLSDHETHLHVSL